MHCEADRRTEVDFPGTYLANALIPLYESPIRSERAVRFPAGRIS
jgi:hypothetical protein